jgi:hypothetical protein
MNQMPAILRTTPYRFSVEKTGGASSTVSLQDWLTSVDKIITESELLEERTTSSTSTSSKDDPSVCSRRSCLVGDMGQCSAGNSKVDTASFERMVPTRPPCKGSISNRFISGKRHRRNSFLIHRVTGKGFIPPPMEPFEGVDESSDDGGGDEDQHLADNE